jgi:cytochrome c-type biogenesis protein CcmH/NrfG
MGDNLRIEELKRRVQMDPASIAFAALAEEYRRSGRFEDAIAACTAGLHRHPAYISAHVTLGRVLLALGRSGEAKAQFEHVLMLAPENLAAIRGLVEIHTAPSTDEMAPGAVNRSWAGRIESFPAVCRAIPQHAVGPTPALGGLEAFLGAIARARTGRMLCR